MMDFLTNNKEFEVQANNQLSSILGFFDTDNILGIAEDVINQMFTRFDLASRPNMVNSIETNFKTLEATYSEKWDDFERNNFYDTKINLYTSIIKMIANKYNITLNQIESINRNTLYSLAYYMYDFFVSRFDYYLVTFFTRFLQDEKEDLYNSFNLDSVKKNKDTSTIYGKMIFEQDEKLSIISANIPVIIPSLSYLDISDQKILEYIYPNNPDVVNLFTTYLIPQIGYFNIFTSLLNNEQLKTDIMIQVRLKLQQINYKPNKTEN